MRPVYWTTENIFKKQNKGAICAQKPACQGYRIRNDTQLTNNEKKERNNSIRIQRVFLVVVVFFFFLSFKEDDLGTWELTGPCT